MSRLGDLVKSVEDMSTEELLSLTRAIRADRKIIKAAPKKEASGAAKKKASDKLTALLQAMSPEERTAFVKNMATGGKK